MALTVVGLAPGSMDDIHFHTSDYTITRSSYLFPLYIYFRWASMLNVNARFYFGVFTFDRDLCFGHEPVYSNYKSIIAALFQPYEESYQLHFSRHIVKNH